MARFKSICTMGFPWLSKYNGFAIVNMIASLSKNRDKPQKHSAIPQARHSKFFWRSFCICNFLKCLEQLTANDSHELILGLVIRCDIVIHVIVCIAYLVPHCTSNNFQGRSTTLSLNLITQSRYEVEICTNDVTDDNW